MNKGLSSLDLYYRDAGKFSLLSREEENRLGNQVRKNGRGKKSAIKKLIESNLRLVAKIAQDFQGRGLDLEDLINEGNIGLCVAAGKFDPSKGAKFSYYASFWIRQGILRAIANQGRLIRIPVNSLDKYFKIITFINKYKKKHSEAPSQERIAKRFRTSEKRIAQIMGATEAVVPLDSKVGDEGESKIHDAIPDGSLTPYEKSRQGEDYKMINLLVSKLPKREGFIIENRFGLNGCEKVTLENLGRRLNITRERVRQLETSALAKLKNLAKIRM